MIRIRPIVIYRSLWIGPDDATHNRQFASQKQLATTLLCGREGNHSMKVRIGTAVGLVLYLGVAVAKPPMARFSARQTPAGVTEEMSTTAKSVAASGCIAELWEHVYRKARLHIVENCIAVTGTIRHVKREADGDEHIQLAVDPEFEKLLNGRNKTAQGDTLIVEPICQGPATRADAEAACQDFHSPVEVPSAGTKVRVVGSYVLDTAQGWMEIHPVSSIEVRH
jgi:hypothetical protein